MVDEFLKYMSCIGDIEFIYSGRKDRLLMVNNEAVKSCLEWEGINNTMLVANFMSNKCWVSAIVVYDPAEPVDGDSSD